ncbi:MAG: demethoxyubiquinone hydroxylase family protein [Bauldia litoralis]
MTGRAPRRTGDTLLPGDPDRAELVERMIRVNQAGEFGAARIYAGQLAVLGKSEDGPVLRHMAEQEQRHLDIFDKMIVDRRVRPTVLSPLWHVAGFALGAGTAMLGREAAMACTVAVEEVIDEHYAHQRDQLGDDESELRETIEEFRREEVEHRDTAMAHDARNAPGYELLTGAVKAGSRLAIWLSQRF